MIRAIGDFVNEFIAATIEKTAEIIEERRTDGFADLDVKILRSAAKIIRESRHVGSLPKKGATS